MSGSNISRLRLESSKLLPRLVEKSQEADCFTQWNRGLFGVFPDCSFGRITDIDTLLCGAGRVVRLTLPNLCPRAPSRALLSVVFVPV